MPCAASSRAAYHHADVHGHTLEVLERTVELTGPGEPGQAELRACRRRRARGGHSPAGRAARGSDDARAGAALGGAPARRRQAPHQGVRRRRSCDVHRPRRPRSRAGPGAARPPARERAAARPRFGPRSTPSAARLPRSRAPAALPAQRVRLHARLLAGGGRRDPAVGRRPARHPGRARARGDRSAPRSRRGPARGCAATGARTGRRPSWCEGTSSRQLCIAPGPALGELLEELAEARYAGEIASREQALTRARELVGRPATGLP